MLLTPVVFIGLMSHQKKFQHYIDDDHDAIDEDNGDACDHNCDLLLRKWQIKTTQYTCESEMAPRKDCLQYHTAQYGWCHHQIAQILSNFENHDHQAPLHLLVGTPALQRWQHHKHIWSTSNTMFASGSHHAEGSKIKIGHDLHLNYKSLLSIEVKQLSPFELISLSGDLEATVQFATHHTVRLCWLLTI